MNIYIDRRKDGKIAVTMGDEITLFDDRASAEAYARRLRGKTFALILSSLEPLEEKPAPPAGPVDPKDRARVTVKPATLVGPKASAFTVYEVVWRWRRRSRVIATFVADPTNPQSMANALEHAKEFAADAQEELDALDP